MEGTSIAHYQILEKLGEGGMGVVYKARDLHLDRFVGIKLLSREWVRDPERNRRFIQEARAASALNHPNIITIHDISAENEVSFLVMEYVPGHTLDQLIARKGLPLKDTLRYAVQIASALGRAHAAGIIHRDLKPANIMVTDGGDVKVLDFGLAKLSEPLSGETVLAGARTQPASTAEGTILGTVAYMSPEQAEGKKVDSRSDIFSFGSVLYEMITGRRAFPGESAVSTLAAILHLDPQPVEGIPLDLGRIISRCLRKEPEHRFQHMEDLKVELDDLAAQSDSTLRAATAPAVRKPGSLLPWTVAALLALTTSALLFLLLKPRIPPDTGKIRFRIDVPQAELHYPIALSPDGRQLVYVASSEGKRQAFLRSLDSMQIEPIAGISNATDLSFSQDGRSLIFFDGVRLQRVPASGGAPSALLDLGPNNGSVAGSDGSVLYSGVAAGGGVARIPPGGGKPEILSRPNRESGEFIHGFPQLLADGTTVLFTVVRAGLALGKHNIAVATRGWSSHRVVLDDGYVALYSSGQLIFRRSSFLYAVAFDTRRLEISGAPVVIADDAEPSLFCRCFAVSKNGTLAYIRRDPDDGLSVPSWFDRNGAAQPLPVPKDQFCWPSVSPDGKHVALTRKNWPRGDIWTWDLAREVFTRTTLEGANHAAIWAPDGLSMVISSDLTGPQANLWRIRTDGTGKPERLTTSTNHQDPAAFSPDGKLLVFAELKSTITDADISVLHLDGGLRVEPFLKTQFTEHSPAMSPDGNWLAYTSNESGREEVYVQPFPAGGPKVQISTGGGGEALWAPDGRELYYRNGQEIMAAAVNTRAGFSAQKPRLLFKGDFAPREGYGRPNWDISADGKRFLLLQVYHPPAPRARQIQVVVNAFADLRKP